MVARTRTHREQKLDLRVIRSGRSHYRGGNLRINATEGGPAEARKADDSNRSVGGIEPFNSPLWIRTPQRQSALCPKRKDIGTGNHGYAVLKSDRGRTTRAAALTFQVKLERACEWIQVRARGRTDRTTSACLIPTGCSGTGPACDLEPGICHLSRDLDD